jgi:hypothetical protein
VILFRAVAWTIDPGVGRPWLPACGRSRACLFGWATVTGLAPRILTGGIDPILDLMGGPWQGR